MMLFFKILFCIISCALLLTIAFLIIANLIMKFLPDSNKRIVDDFRYKYDAMSDEVRKLSKGVERSREIENENMELKAEKEECEIKIRELNEKIANFKKIINKIKQQKGNLSKQKIIDIIESKESANE